MSALVLDLFGVLILVYNLLRGMTTGLVRTSVGMLAMASASYCAWQMPGLAGPLVDPIIPPGVPLAFLLRPVVVWSAAYLAVNSLGVGLRWLVGLTPLVMADRIGGAVFGLCTGLLLVLAPMLLIANFPLLQQIPGVQWALAQSFLARTLAPLVQAVLHLAPATLPANPA